jgi:hypothetical protein
MTKNGFDPDRLPAVVSLNERIGYRSFGSKIARLGRGDRSFQYGRTSIFPRPHFAERHRAAAGLISAG